MSRTPDVTLARAAGSPPASPRTDAARTPGPSGAGLFAGLLQQSSLSARGAAAAGGGCGGAPRLPGSQPDRPGGSAVGGRPAVSTAALADPLRQRVSRPAAGTPTAAPATAPGTGPAPAARARPGSAAAQAGASDTAPVEATPAQDSPPADSRSRAPSSHATSSGEPGGGEPGARDTPRAGAGMTEQAHTHQIDQAHGAARRTETRRVDHQRSDQQADQRRMVRLQAGQQPTPVSPADAACADHAAACALAEQAVDDTAGRFAVVPDAAVPDAATLDPTVLAAHTGAQPAPDVPGSQPTGLPDGSGAQGLAPAPGPSGALRATVPDADTFARQGAPAIITTGASARSSMATLSSDGSTARGRGAIAADGLPGATMAGSPAAGATWAAPGTPGTPGTPGRGVVPAGDTPSALAGVPADAGGVGRAGPAGRGVGEARATGARDDGAGLAGLLAAAQGTPPAVPMAAVAPDAVAALPRSSISTPVDDPRFGTAVMLRVGELAVGGVQQATLDLNPAEMGPIQIRLSLDGQDARIDFSAAHEDTRMLLEAALPALAAALGDDGLRLAGAQVSSLPEAAPGSPLQGDATGGAGAGRGGAEGRPASGRDQAGAPAATPAGDVAGRRLTGLVAPGWGEGAASGGRRLAGGDGGLGLDLYA